ncbi:MAG: hypothetical protein AUK48_13300 [Oscillatoriales cyanobacterium CG2_30_44_21]|nr:MAG: hypothetical protein AUK48_13300 [Oscillatoriales cyanobacterium CG2_30_44_21]
MSREVIQDFLHLAGVVGIALTNRRMRPYFYGLDSVLDRTKQALGQGVLQVVENVPEGCESFEFYFANHIVFIYKLKHGLVLLVLTDNDLKPVNYERGIAKIKYLIETDTYNTVAYFKLLLGSVTQQSLPSNSWNATSTQSSLSNQPSVQRSSNSASSRTADAIAASTTANSKPPRIQTQPPIAKPPTPTVTQSNIKPTSPPLTPTAARAEATASNRAVTSTPTKLAVSTKSNPQAYRLDELLVALNKLSEFTTQYLGKVVVTNYWKSSRPSEFPWLAEFEVDRSGSISHPKQAAIACTTEQHQQIQAWASAYVKRCKQVIRDFDKMLVQDCLSSRQKQILFE